MSRVIAVVACGLALVGCTSGMPSLDFLPKAEPVPVTVQFQSEPVGAEAKTSLGESCQTPCALAMAPDKDFSVTFALAGYQPQTIKVGRPEGAASGDEVTLQPNPVFVELAPAPKAPAKRSPAPRKPATAAAPAAPATPAAPKPAAAAADPWPPVR